LVERDESQRRREVQARNKAQLAEMFAGEPVWTGIPAGSTPDGVTPAAAILQAAKNALPGRQSVLEHALGDSDGLEYRPLRTAPE
jgi:hypothetical protein